MKTATVLAPDESCELGIEYDNGKLYAGFIHNVGMSHNWEIDYDKDFTFDENLQALYENICENWNDISGESNL